jgi:hypothetical protein
MSFTLSNLLFASPASLFAAALVTAGGTRLMVDGLVGLLVVSVLTAFAIKDHPRRDLTTFEPRS